VWEGACLEVLLVDGVRKTVGPIGKQARRCVTFGLKEIVTVVVTRGKLLKGSATRGRRMYEEWTSYSVVVVGSEVRVVPIEAILAFR